MLQRVQKVLAAAGVASRRKSDDLVLQGRVTINNKLAITGQKADPEKDVIAVDGRVIGFQKKRYIMLYKPAGFVTTTEDRYAERMVTDLLPTVQEKVYPVGRLDIDAEGLLILTNDGEFANLIAHPSHEVEKTYVVKVRNKLSPEDIDMLKSGVFVENRRVHAKVRMVQKDVAEITIHEGRHKIVKRMFKAVGNYVLRITRTRVGFLTLGNLKLGKWRELTPDEIRRLREEAGKHAASHFHEQKVKNLRAEKQEGDKLHPSFNAAPVYERDYHSRKY